MIIKHAKNIKYTTAHVTHFYVLELSCGFTLVELYNSMLVAVFTCNAY